MKIFKRREQSLTMTSVTINEKIIQHSEALSAIAPISRSNDYSKKKEYYCYNFILLPEHRAISMLYEYNNKKMLTLVFHGTKENYFSYYNSMKNLNEMIKILENVISLDVLQKRDIFLNVCFGGYSKKINYPRVFSCYSNSIFHRTDCLAEALANRYNTIST